MAKKKARREKAKKEDPDMVEADLSGENWMVEHNPKEEKVVITIDTSGKTHPSKSGKMNLIASSRGWVTIGGISLSFNVGLKVK